MIDGVVIKQLEKYNDERGWLCEVYRQDEVSMRPAMAYLSVTKPGIVRGPHEHREQSDCFVFAGPGDFELYLWDRRSGQPVSTEAWRLVVGQSNPVMVVVPPGVVHGYKCLGPDSGYCFNLSDQLYRGEGKQEEIDEIRWEKQADSPYVID